MDDYLVKLDVFNGPLDLLLYLIRREEVDIYDIPIARVTEQYVQHVELLQKIDPDLAGQFMVMAATLLELKTRMLLPSPAIEDVGDGEFDGDPRAELVRQLLEYKAFKDAAGELADAASTQSQKYPRKPAQPEVDHAEVDLEDLQVWDLLDAFGRLMEQIGQAEATHDIIYDDTPIELHAADVIDMLKREGPLDFERIFSGRTSRSEIVGLFLALLELVRQHQILTRQSSNFGQISIELNPDPPELDEDSQNQGTYTSDRPAGDETDEGYDDNYQQDQPTGT